MWELAVLFWCEGIVRGWRRRGSIKILISICGFAQSVEKYESWLESVTRVCEKKPKTLQSTHSLPSMRRMKKEGHSKVVIFQSTHSLARMRPMALSLQAALSVFQSTHSLARMRHAERLVQLVKPWISIHALPRKNATSIAFIIRICRTISIHALPRKNATCLRRQNTQWKRYFNPRIPSQEWDSNHYQKSLLIPSISYPYCTPPLSKTQPLYFHRTIFSHKSPISQCESSYIFMFT